MTWNTRSSFPDNWLISFCTRRVSPRICSFTQQQTTCQSCTGFKHSNYWAKRHGDSYWEVFLRCYYTAKQLRTCLKSLYTTCISKHWPFKSCDLADLLLLFFDVGYNLHDPTGVCRATGVLGHALKLSNLSLREDHFLPSSQATTRWPVACIAHPWVLFRQPLPSSSLGRDVFLPTAAALVSRGKGIL